MRQLITNTRKSPVLIFFTVVMAASAPRFASLHGGVARQSALISSEGYARILDLIFPHEDVPSLRVSFTMVLRFERNEGPESQLLLRAWHDGRSEATFYVVKGGSAWNLANSYIAKTGTEDIGAIAKSIVVETRRVKFNSAELDRWQAQLFEALRASNSQLQKSAAEYAKDGSREAILDGTRYELRYSQGETQLRWSFSDIDISDVPSRSDLPLARWMNAVRVAAATKQ